MAGEVRIPIGLNTDTALQDAKKLEADVKRTLSKVDMGTANSKTLTFVKNLTSAYNRMQKLADEAQRLSNTKLPTEDYAYYNKQLEKALSSLTKLQAKQDQIEQDRNTIHAREKSIVVDIENAEARLQEARSRNDLNAVEEADHLVKQLKAEQMSLPAEVRRLDDAWTRVNGRIEQLSPVITDLQSQLNQLVEQNEAFTSGRDSQAYREKADALNVQNQALNILLLRYAELNESAVSNIQATNQETDAIQRQTKATQDLSQARRELSNGRGGVVRGPQLHHRRGISRGPALDTVDDVRFLRQGETVAELSRYAQAENEADRVERRRAEMLKLNASLPQTNKMPENLEKSTSAMTRLGKAVRTALRPLSLFSRHLRESNRGQVDLGKTMRRGLMTVMRYALGIRSFYMLFRRLRSIVKEAFKVMAQEIPEVNKVISDLLTNVKTLKASTGTLFQPLLNTLAPALDTIIQKLVSLMNTLAKLFAQLSGQNYIYKATVDYYDYAKAVDEASGSLASFDRLNVVSQGKSPSLALDKDTVHYAKEYFDKIDFGNNKVFRSLKNTLMRLKSLISTIGDSIKEVFLGDIGASIFEHVQNVLINILDLIGNIAENFETAWKTDNIGTDILESIASIFNSIWESIDKITKATADWALNVDLVPALTGARDVLDEVSQAVNTISEIVTDLYTNYLLDMATWMTETVIPKVLTVVRDLLNLINGILLWLKPKLKWIMDNVVKPIAGTLGQLLTDLLDKIHEILDTKIKPVLKDLGDKLDETIIPALKNLAEWVIPKIQTAIMVFGAVVGKIIEAICGFAADMITVFSGVLDFFSDVFAGDLEAAWNDIKLIFFNGINAVISLIETVINGVIDGINVVGDIVGFTIDNISLPRIGQEELALKKAKEMGLSTNPKDMQKYIQEMFKKMANWDSIPKMAQGAVLPPNKPFLAMVGDQTNGTNVETPLSTIQEAVASVIQTMGIKVVFDVQGDPKHMFKAMQKEAKIYYNQTGNNAYAIS